MATALITGCSTGIGRATAHELARRGLDVIATARNPDTLRGLPAECRALDVTDGSSVLALTEEFPQIDVLVNNAGILVEAPVESVPLDEVRAAFETNVFGPLRLVQGYAPAMRQRGSGCIVNVSSIAGRVVAPLAGPYAATKHALEALTDALRYELSPFGVRVVLVEPGAIDTPVRESAPRLVADDSPYAGLARQWWDFMGSTFPASASPPELVGRVIADAIEMEAPALRHPAGPDAEYMLGARAAMSDDAFESLLAELNPVRWPPETTP